MKEKHFVPLYVFFKIKSRKKGVEEQNDNNYILIVHERNGSSYILKGNLEIENLHTKMGNYLYLFIFPGLGWARSTRNPRLFKTHLGITYINIL